MIVTDFLHNLDCVPFTTSYLPSLRKKSEKAKEEGEKEAEEKSLQGFIPKLKLSKAVPLFTSPSSLQSTQPQRSWSLGAQHT